MKALKTLVLAKSIAAAIVASAGIAAPAISHASPDDGMVCRVADGYSAQFANGNQKCARQLPERVIALDCPATVFTRKQIRVKVGVSDGRDVCTRENGPTIPFDSALTGLVPGGDFVFPTFNPSRVAGLREATERAEERRLTLADDAVDAKSTFGATTGSLVIDAQTTGAIDGVKATITLFTFAIPALNLTISPFVSISR